MLKKLLVTTCLSILILGFILFNCKLPAPPPGPDEAKVSLLLKSSNGKIDHTGSIQDSVGKEVQIGIVLNLTQYIDSSVVRVILDADTERTIPWAFKKNMVDTVFFPITFTKAGTHNVEITSYITGQPNSVAEGKIIIYGPLQENKKPELKVPGTQSAVVGQAVSFSVSASDPDAGQLVTISASQKPEHATFTADTFRWTPGVADTGTVKVVFIATDNGAPVMADIDTVTIIVNATKVNHTPQWYTKSMQRTIKTGTQFLYDLSSICSDPDNEKITFSLIAAPPAGDTIIGSAYSFSPTGADTGKYTIHIMAQDSSGLTDTLTVGITVSTIDVPDSLPPVIHFKSPSKDTVISADSFEVKVSCIDDSGCSVKGYLDTTAFALKRSASIKSLWTGTVMGIAAGRYSTIKIVATDSSKAKNRDSSTVRIKYDNDKSGPVITLVNPVKDSVTINTSSYMVIVKVADPSGVLSVNGTSRDTIYTGVRDTGSLWKITISTLEDNKVTAMVLTATDSSLKANKTLDTVYIKSEIVNGYKIKFDKNDSTATGTMADQTINSGDSAKLTTNTFVKTGSIFAGWMTSPTGTTVSYSDGALFKIGTAPVTLYAKWVKKTTFTLTITAANGSVTKSPDATVYDSGTVVTLTPVPSTNYHFSGWSGALTDTANPSTITMNGDKSVTAGFVVNSPNTFTLTVAASNGTVKKTPDLPQYDSGSTVGLKAAASTGYRFVNWSGDAAGTIDSATVIMNKVKTVTATFIRTCTLTISSTNGTVTKSPDAAVYDSGTVVTLTPVPSTNYHFSGWSGALTDTTNPSTITMNGDKSVTAGFVANPPNTFTLTVAASNGSVKKTPDLPQYDSGSTVGLKATASTGYRFVNWSGDAAGTTDSTTVVVNKIKTVTANFIRTFSLTISSTNGTVTKSPDAAVYDSGTVVTLTPVPSTNYHFSGWSGALTGTANPSTITMNGDKSVTAGFVANPPNTFTLTITASNGSVKKTPDLPQYDSGSTIGLKASAGTGYKFVNWTGDATGTTDSTTVVINNVTNITANFSPIPYTVTFSSQGTTYSTATVNYNALATEPAAPQAGACYTFGGWYTSETYATKWDFTTDKITGTTTLFAKWTQLTYIVTYSSNGAASGTAPAQQTKTCGVALTLATNSGNLIKTDVTFSGWNTAADGTGTDYAQGVSYIANAPLALFAKWNTVYTVTYNANGGTGSVPVDTNKYQNGQVVTVPGAGALNRPDFSFAGWNTQADTLGTNVGVSFPMGSANVVLFAKWRMNPPVISTHPVSATCPVNDTVSFRVVASGPGLSYQWQKNGGNIVGATAASYTPPALTVADTAATYRCVVSNAGGNVNSNGATLSINTLTDADGNVYHQVKIGTQVWTMENLRVTKTNDNTGIPKDTSSSTWYNATTPKFCFYSNSTDPAENKKWGALYNWHAVSTGKLAPPGWHVPDTTDWKKLERYLIDNGYNCDGTTAGNSIAHVIAATTDWSNTSIVCTPGENSSTNNESGFSALPSGYRSNTGGFTHRGVYCIWWTSSGQPNSVNARYRYIINTSSSLLEDNNTKDFGFSVRLVKD
jgi:uncharacterized protein (TIGR02145 family)